MQYLFGKVSKVSHDSLFIPTIITKPIIFAMVAWFYHYQAMFPSRNSSKRLNNKSTFLLGENSAEMN